MRYASSFAAVVGVCAVVASASAGDFAMDSKVYDGKRLMGESTTLFVGSKVYDFLKQPDETIVLAPAEGRIVLMDNVRRVRTELTTAEVAAFCEQLREKARQSESESIRFFADPEFREALDPETDEVTLGSAFIEYRAKTLAPPSADELRRYQQHLSWQAQLNAVLNPGSPPPFARMKLNEALATRQLLAEQVTMRRTAIVRGFGSALRSEHHYTWRIDDPDRRRIEEVNDRLASYRLVSAPEYLRPLVAGAEK